VGSSVSSSSSSVVIVVDGREEGVRGVEGPSESKVQEAKNPPTSGSESSPKRR
jgi:hypothetical protein